MGLHMVDRGISQRAAAFVYERAAEAGSVKAYMGRLGLDRKMVSQWKSGQTAPSVYALQALAFAGADMNYILKGG